MTHPDAPVGTRPTDNKVIATLGRAAQVRLPAEGPRRPGRGARPGRFRGRGGGRGAEVLLPQERGGAAGTGPGPVRHAARCVKTATRRSSRRTWPASRCWRASASFRAAPETQIYSIANTDLCLIATAEITLGGMHRDRSSTRRKLPLKYVGLSHCFRTEAGAPGRDTRGLYRVHQFTKVEMFAFCTPEQSEAIHQELLRHRGGDLPGAGPAVSGHRHLHRRPGRAGLSQVRPGSVDAGPRRRAASTAR